MLVLSRKVDETVVIGDDILVTINRITPERVRIGIKAPGDVRIVRGELYKHSERVQGSDESDGLEFSNEELGYGGEECYPLLQEPVDMPSLDEIRKPEEPQTDE